MATDTAKQSLFYEQVQPVNKGSHGTWSISAEHGYGFAAATNMVPLTVAEFGAAATDYPIVFLKVGDGAIPVAVLGLENEKSYFVGDEGAWEAKYIPAFVRRYPFILSPIEDGKKYVLCLDEAYEGWDKDGQKGQRLYDDDGPTSYLKDVLEFTNKHHAAHTRSVQLGARLLEHDLLSPMQLKLSGPKGNDRSIKGFHAVSREKLQDVDGELLSQWNKSGMLEAIYLHMWSIRNFKDLANKIGTTNDTAKLSASGNIADAKPF